MGINQSEMISLLEQLVEKWIFFVKTVTFKEDVDLAKKMELFEVPIMEFLSKEVGFQVSTQGHIELAHALIATAVDSSGTEPKGAGFAAARKLGWEPDSPIRKPGIHGSIVSRLDAPVKRIGSIILLVGLIMSIIGAFNLDSYNPISNWLNAVFRQSRYATREYWMCAWGSYLTTIGFLFSFGYESTIAKLLRWIQKG